MTPDRCAVVFDWNGTLLDDTALCATSTSKVSQKLGGHQVTIEKLQENYILPLTALYTRFGCEKEVIEKNISIVYDDFSAHYDQHVHLVPLREGAEHVLTSLQANGHKSVILSNHTVSCISQQVDRLGLREYFTDILANGAQEYLDLMHKADKGSRLKAYVDRHNIERALVVGDSAEEIQIAHHYGFLGVGITGGFVSEERIRAANPDFVIHSLTELPAIAAEVFGRGGAL
ncbi:MAG: HAD family hydrolase [Alphaproteobacteria bacterium]|jgi:phosphoglycolate phosphatase|nr:HAD family hydrolase [Alphaproteobacteria bacterium]